ncbi:MAG: T9SS type A sorting domain-containing protein [Crocinitomicaceae bacterium]|nr:T9SS type A sorting domain-containing protein [Crocinitomicaceae bacterium]
MKKIYAFAGALLLSGIGFAQSPFKVNQHQFTAYDKYTPGAISVKPSRTVVNNDRTTYYTENFDGGLNGWIGTIQTGSAGFGLTSTGHQNSASNSFQIPALATSTPTNWVLLDSDGDGTSYTAAEQATFNSPKIDLSATTGDFVALQFDQFFAEWDMVFQTGTNGSQSSDHCYIAVSVDSTNWTEIEINDGVDREARPNPEFITWDITDAIAGNLSTVWFRFRWEGAWNYGWQFDNVKVSSIPEKDLEVVDIWRPMSNTSGGGLYMYSQVPFLHVDTVIFGAIVRNVGHVTQTNVDVDFELNTPGGPMGGTSGLAISSMAPTPNVDTILFGTTYVPDAVGTYTTKFKVVSTEGDDFSDNDSIVDAYYEVTDYTYATDYPVGAELGCDVWPLSGNNQAWYGNVFIFKVDDIISGIDCKIANNSSNVGEEVVAEIFSFDGVNGIWVSEWSNTSNVYVLGASDIGNWITIPVPGGFVATQAQESYLVTVSQYANTTDPVFAKQGDAKLSRVQGYGFSNTSGDYGGQAFFDRISPMVRARVNAAEVSIEENEIVESFSVYPNPANDQINIAMTLDNAPNTVINVLDITGKVIKRVDLGLVNGDKTMSISLDNVTTGVYFIEMINDNGRMVKKFTKK